VLATAQPWRTAWERLRRNYVVRWSAVVGIAGALFLAPFAGLVVPIAQEFRADRPISGASFLMASISVGQLCSPVVVRRLAAHRTELWAAASSTALCGGVLIMLAVVSALMADVVGELAVWLVIGVAFGAMRYGAQALYFGAAAESGPTEEAPANLAAVMLSTLLLGPFGVGNSNAPRPELWAARALSPASGTGGYPFPPSRPTAPGYVRGAIGTLPASVGHPHHLGQSETRTER
jgi:hypothetical protein